MKFSIKVFLKAIRYHQWAKNLLLFVPLGAVHKVFEPVFLMKAMIAFVAFCFCASATYLINDILDLEHDKLHPTKKNRALASGLISLSFALKVSITFYLLAFTLSFFVNVEFVFLLLGYIVITLAYSFYIKKIEVLDVFILASLYTLRIFAGGVAIHVSISFWLLAFSVFFFLGLGILKRYTELVGGLKNNQLPMQGRGYHANDKELLGIIGLVSGFLSVLVLALYINSDIVTKLYRSPKLLWFLCPIFLYWMTRYWFLAHRGKMHDDPVFFALTDKVSIILGLLSLGFMVTAAIV